MQQKNIVFVCCGIYLQVYPVPYVYINNNPTVYLLFIDYCLLIIDQVATKVEETDTVMAEVEAVSQQYIPLANSCSSVYFSLEALNQVCYIIYILVTNYIIYYISN